MQLFGLAGWKGSGKTELMARLLPVLVARGFAVSAVKEARRDFDIDQPGKDSFEHRTAGATEVMLASSHRWALMHERRGQDDAPRLSEIVSRMSAVDLVLAEGFRHEPHPKLEVHRTGSGKPLLAATDPTILAVASDRPIAGLEHPVLPLADAEAIAEFVLETCGLRAPARRGLPGAALRATRGGGRD